MNDPGLEDFRGSSADPASLWMVGRSHLPLMAAQLSRAGQKIDVQLAPGAFNNPTTQSDGTVRAVPGPVSGAWERLHDAFQSALYQSAENLYDAGEALVAVACAFAETDEDVADQIARSIELHQETGLWEIPTHRPMPPEAEIEFAERVHDEAFPAPDSFTDPDGNQVAL